MFCFLKIYISIIIIIKKIIVMSPYRSYLRFVVSLYTTVAYPCRCIYVRVT